MPDDGPVLGYGISVGGVPIGDRGYVAAFMASKADELMSKIDNVKEKIRSRHFSILVFSDILLPESEVPVLVAALLP